MPIYSAYTYIITTFDDVEQGNALVLPENFAATDLCRGEMRMRLVIICYSFVVESKTCIVCGL